MVTPELHAGYWMMAHTQPYSELFKTLLGEFEVVLETIKDSGFEHTGDIQRKLDVIHNTLTLYYQVSLDRENQNEVGTLI